jgi:hypothetical protein
MENGNNLVIVLRLVEVLMKAPILCQRVRTIFALLRYTWGERRKDGNFTTKEFCNWTGITGKRASELISEMIRRQIFRQRKVGHRRVLMFNKYYTQWILSEKIRHRKNIKDIPIDYGLKPCVMPAIKEIENMDQILLEVKIKWNDLAEKQREDGIRGFFGIEDIFRIDRKLDSAITTRLQEHPREMIIQAIENYDRYLRIPKEKRLWHQRWRCHEFFIRGKDNISRFMDWTVVEDNWLKREFKTVAGASKPPIRLEQAQVMLGRNQTTDAMLEVFARLVPEDKKDFRAWIAAQDDNLRAVYQNAGRIWKKKKGKK